jgi:hypothetical protein
MVIFLGSQEPLQLPRHLTHFPVGVRAWPYLHFIHKVLSAESHSRHPNSHWKTQSVFTKVDPLTQVRQTAKSVGSHVLQFP